MSHNSESACRPTGRRVFLTTAFLALALAVWAPTAGATWCGENGVVRFSFADGDSLVPVLITGEPENGVTTVDLYAWLTDVDPIAQDGEALLRVGGFELKLDVQGAEAFILAQDLAGKGINVGKSKGSIVAGLNPGQRLKDGRAQLAHWKIMFQGRPTNVRFGLDAAGCPSCARDEGCARGGSYADYVGVNIGNQLQNLFGAGYAPAWLNPTAQDPDLAPRRGKENWRQVGVYQAR